VSTSKMRGFLLACATAALLSTTSTAVAQDDSEGVIKYRQSTMKALGGHMGAAAQIVRGNVSYTGQLPMHADSIAAIARDITALFPEGSDFGETRAKEAVWENPEGFKKTASDAARASEVFAEAVKGGNKATIERSFRSLSDTCKNCHKKFRKKEE
jgi:cytochrome c556